MLSLFRALLEYQLQNRDGAPLYRRKTDELVEGHRQVTWDSERRRHALYGVVRTAWLVHRLNESARQL